METIDWTAMAKYSSLLKLGSSFLFFLVGFIWDGKDAFKKSP